MKRAWIPLLAFASVVAIFGVSIYVGRNGEDSEAIDWELAGIIGTALGTTLLAAATGALAYSTSRDVSATQRMVELTQGDIENRNRPVLTAIALPLVGPHDAPRMKIEIHNVGEGPATKITLNGFFDDGSDDLPPAKVIEIAPLRAGEQIGVEVPVPAPTSAPRIAKRMDRRFTARGFYCNRDGTKMYATPLIAFPSPGEPLDNRVL